jgi:thiamine-monophosphate kinase
VASRRAGSDRAGGGGHPAAGSGLRRDDLGLGDGAEFDLIRSFLHGAVAGREDVRVGPGDDACVLANGVVLSVDMSVEGVHFRRDWLAPDEIGYRATMAALSDLAAMAASPLGVLASLAIGGADRTLGAEVMVGVRDAIERVGGVLLGGDLTRSPAPLVLDVVAVGSTSAPVLRSGARPGDELWVTGELGGAALAVATLAAGATPDPAARRRFAAPAARVAEAAWLAARHLPAAMLDLSDGLAGDLSHLARSSDAAMVIEAGRIPIHPSINVGSAAAAASEERAANGEAQAALIGVGGPLADDPALHLALSGGEDYELCFAARAGTVEPHRVPFQQLFGLELSRVGRVEAGGGVYLERVDGTRTTLTAAGYQHFGGRQ